MSEPEAPIHGPFPYLNDWGVARGWVRGSAHRMAQDLLTEADLTAAWKHRMAWQGYWERENNRRRRQQAKKRAEERATLAHPNWQNRRPECIWPVIGRSTWKDTERARLAKRPWALVPQECGRRVVAYDGTDRRASGYLYGACAKHLMAALNAAEGRVWLWADGSPMTPDEDVEAHVALLALAGTR